MAHALQTKVDWQQAHRELQAQLAEWDAIDLLGAGAPADEYDVLVWPLMQQLDGGAGAEQIASWLSGELPRRFGALPSAAEVERFARRTAKWFHARWPTPPTPER
jgi:hypothetical protein